MPVGWFVAPYKRRLLDRRGRQIRYVAVNDVTQNIRAGDGGRGEWRETEILGDHAVVVASTSSGALAEIEALDGVTRLPGDGTLTWPLSSLTARQRTDLRALVLALGYTSSDWAGAFPNGDSALGTLSDVLRMLTSRRRRLVYNAQTDAWEDGGRDVTPTPVADLDRVRG